MSDIEFAEKIDRFVVSQTIIDQKKIDFQISNQLVDLGFSWFGMTREGFFVKKSNYSYESDVDNEIDAIIIKICAGLGIKCSTGRISSIREHIRALSHIDPMDFESEREIVVFKNGIWNCARNKFFTENTTCIPILNAIPFDFKGLITDDDADLAEKFERFLEVSNVDKKQIYELIGYCLTKSISFKKAFILVGKKNAGKSILLHIIEKLIGKKNVSGVPLQGMSDRFVGQYLAFKQLNICQDLPEKVPLTTSSFFKQLVGDQTMYYIVKGGGSRNCINTCKCVFSTNALPPVYEDSESFYDRWIIIDFPREVPENERIPDLVRYITEDKEEMEKIVATSLYHYKQVKIRGHFTNNLNCEEVEHRWKMESDVVYRFLNEMCRRNAIAEVSSQILFSEFQDYLQDKVVDRAFTMTKFTQKLGKNCVQQQRRHTTYGMKSFFMGIELLNESKYMDEEIVNECELNYEN